MSNPYYVRVWIDACTIVWIIIFDKLNTVFLVRENPTDQPNHSYLLQQAASTTTCTHLYIKNLPNKIFQNMC